MMVVMMSSGTHIQGPVGTYEKWRASENIKGGLEKTEWDLND